MFLSGLKLKKSFLFLYRDYCNERNDISKMSESTLLESSVSDSSSLAATPGNVVWARTECQLWWPAEVFTFISVFWFMSQYGI